MPLLFLLRRYLVPKEGNLLSFALWVSVVGVVIGIIQLMLVLSVMSGFLDFLEEKYTAISSDIVVIPRGTTPESKVGDGLKTIPEISAITPFGLGQSMLVKTGVAGVTLEGIELETANKVTNWEKIFSSQPLKSDKVPSGQWIWLGNQLAKKIKAQVGDSVEIMIPGQKDQLQPFIVTAITKFGLYDHDLHYARIDLRTLKKIFNKENVAPLYKVKLKNNVPLMIGAKAIKARFKQDVQVKTWNQINQNLFLAVEDQKSRLFLVLEIIVGLAGVNVISLLMMSSHYRKRDMAILRAMGLKARGVFLFFIAQGAVVGAIGVLFGVFFGVVACKLVERFQPAILSEAIYNTDRLPFKIQTVDIMLISVVAFGLCVIFSAIPALKAAYAKPVEALRYE
ncbi:MAG: ABC transporter permease [Proteobacteria bacterium]|nr:ABC transporter permease [Pseudomonadota bacterium]